MNAARQQVAVRCLNCGSSDSLALIGIIIATAAFVVSMIALYIAVREHRVFMRQLNARARFKLSARVVNGAAPDLIETDGEFAGARVEIRVENVGDKAAGPTFVEVLLPENVQGLYWITESGSLLSGRDDRALSAETLRVAGQGDVKTQYLSLDLPRGVRLRTPVIHWLQFGMSVPAEVPLRVKARADELPEDEESILDYVVHARRLDTSG